VLGVAYFLFAPGLSVFWTRCATGAFNVVSVATTAGFASTFQPVAIFAPVWLLFLCCFALVRFHPAASRWIRAS